MLVYVLSAQFGVFYSHNKLLISMKQKAEKEDGEGMTSIQSTHYLHVACDSGIYGYMMFLTLPIHLDIFAAKLLLLNVYSLLKTILSCINN